MQHPRCLLGGVALFVGCALVLAAVLVPRGLTAGAGAPPAGPRAGTVPAPCGNTLTVTVGDNHQALSLAVGDCLVLLLEGPWIWNVQVTNPAVLGRLDEAPPDSQGLYQALRAGQTDVTATGDLPCRAARPPCLAPTRLVRLTVVVDDAPSPPADSSEAAPSLKCSARALPVERAANVWTVNCTVSGMAVDDTSFEVLAFTLDGPHLCAGDLADGAGTCGGRLTVLFDEPSPPLQFFVRAAPSGNIAADLTPELLPWRGR